MKNAKQPVININKPINSHKKQFKKSISSYIGFLVKSTLLFMLFFSLSCQLRAQTGGGNSSGQQDFPAGFVPEVSYRKVTNETYNIPGGLDLYTDFTGIDYVYLEPRFSDEKIFRGRGSDGKRAFVCKYLAPEKQFPPQVLALKQTNMANGKFENITLEGVVITNSFAEYDIKDNTSEEIPNSPEMPRPIIMEDGREKYDLDSLEIIIDKRNRNTFITYFDDRDEWVFRSYIQYDPNDEGRNIPIQEISTTKKISPSGKCVHLITHSKYSEYRNHVKNNEPRKVEVETETFYENILKISPNPTTDQIYIIVKDKEFDSETLEIFSMDGRRMFDGRFNGNWTKLDVSDFPSGLYFVRIMKNGVPFTEKFVKQ